MNNQYVFFIPIIILFAFAFKLVLWAKKDDAKCTKERQTFLTSYSVDEAKHDLMEAITKADTCNLGDVRIGDGTWLLYNQRTGIKYSVPDNIKKRLSDNEIMEVMTEWHKIKTSEGDYRKLC